MLYVAAMQVRDSEDQHACELVAWAPSNATDVSLSLSMLSFTNCFMDQFTNLQPLHQGLTQD